MAVVKYIDKNGHTKYTSNTFIDISGKRFNELKAIRYVGNREWIWRCSCGKEIIRRKNDVVLNKVKSCGHLSSILITEQTYWEWTVIEQLDTRRVRCKCSCGDERVLYKYDLLKGKTKSCGHNTKGSYINGRKNISNTKIGHWYVKEYIGNQRYRCICECGLERNLVGSYIRSQKDKQCNHKSTEIINLKDMIFGEWTVLEYAGNQKWRCRCSCGVEKDVKSYDLRNNKSTNCGHNRISYKRGQKYGMLTLLEKSNGLKWNCLCECGSIKEYVISNLISGSTKSCGCLKDKRVDTLSELIKQTLIDMYTCNNELFAEDVAEALNISVVTVHKYIKTLELQRYLSVKFRSKPERDIYNICKKHVENVIYADRNILNGKELDIYIPEKKLAIEYNGSYWHSEERKDILYHQNKATSCLAKGIRLVSIFDYEWKNIKTREKIISIIETAISNKNSIEIDKESITCVNPDKAKEFINKYSVKDIDDIDISIGCYIKNEIVAVITFKKNEQNRYEMIEMCCKNGMCIEYMYESMLRYFIDNYNPEQILAYIDIAKKDLKEYIKINFTPIKLIEPSYKFVKYNLDVVEESCGEKEDSYMKVYDCGVIKAIWNKKD